MTGTLGAQVRPRIVARPDNGVVVRLPGSPIRRLRLATRDRPRAGNLAHGAHAAASREQPGTGSGARATPGRPAGSRLLRGIMRGSRRNSSASSSARRSRISTPLRLAGVAGISGDGSGRRPARHRIQRHGQAGGGRLPHADRRYEWNGERHMANATDISIPEALAPVVAGVASLHDFGARPLHHVLACPVAAAPRRRISAAARTGCPLMTLPPSTTWRRCGPPATTAPARVSPWSARPISS